MLISCLAELGFDSRQFGLGIILTSFKHIELAQELDYEATNPTRLLANDGKADLLTALNIDDSTMRVVHDFGIPLCLHITSHMNIPLNNLLRFIEHNWIPTCTVELHLRCAVIAKDLNTTLLIHSASDFRLKHADIYAFLIRPTFERTRLLVAAGYDLNSPRNEKENDH